MKYLGESIVIVLRSDRSYWPCTPRYRC